MAQNPGNPENPTLTRPAVTLVDAALELLSKGNLLQERVRFLGFYTKDSMRATGVAPVPGDLWIQYDAAAGTMRLYLQITDRPRYRVWAAVTFEKA